MNQPAAICPLCTTDGGHLVARLPDCRVIRASEAGFPAFYRVIWGQHVAEWSELNEAERARLMHVVTVVEQVLREVLAPTKINLATLGNVVPHLHWHVIARFDWDTHFPAPVWAAAQRPAEDERLAAVAQLLPRVDALLASRLMAV